MFCHLLCMIHGDGGHYIIEHSLEQAYKDAVSRLCKVNRIIDAAMLTLKENQHLCDGDDCTLRELRDAVAEVVPGWEGRDEIDII